MCVLLLGAIGYKLVASGAPAPAAPDMANAGAAGPGGANGPVQRAPDISRMSPRERFDRLFNRVMQASEQGDTAEVERFTPMALGAYAQLDRVDADARYHAAELHLQVGEARPALALADTILAESPGHLFGYLIRGSAAQLRDDSAALEQAHQDFDRHYAAEMAAGRTEYREHGPAIEEFRAGGQAVRRTDGQ
jgi:hypothetical protein